jgi:hypothetical protein
MHPKNLIDCCLLFCLLHLGMEPRRASRRECMGLERELEHQRRCIMMMIICCVFPIRHTIQDGTQLVSYM